jgi:oxygen-independent coproporphyrinogen-3 oxidase
MDRAGLYVHIPFCCRKCAYCDFSSFPGLEHLLDAYVTAVACEAVFSAPHWAETPFESLYFGGGTPSLLEVPQVARLLAALREHFGLLPEAEITLEANPGTVDEAKLGALRALGIRRLSLGIQSLHDDELALLGRIHTAAEAEQAVAWARLAGYDNLSLDLMFGLPGQALERWRATLERALTLRPKHFSLYALTLEEETPLARSISAGALPAPDDDLAADMYDLAEERLAQAGYVHYEISNWALGDEAISPLAVPQYAARHNLVYWENRPYLGLGAAAHSYDGKARWANVDHPAEYIARQRAGQSLEAGREWCDRDRQMDETMMLGLRLMRGVGWADFRRRFATDMRAVYGAQIAALVEDGLLVTDANGVRLSAKGHLLGNRVFGSFLR